MPKQHSTTINLSSIKSARMSDFTPRSIHKNGAAMTNKSRMVTRSAFRSSQRAADLSESNMETNSTPINTFPSAKDRPKISTKNLPEPDNPKQFCFLVSLISQMQSLTVHSPLTLQCQLNIPPVLRFSFRPTTFQ